MVGTITYAVMNCLGEMCSYLPIAGGHIKLAERFVDPAFSFAMGWNYCALKRLCIEILQELTVLQGITGSLWYVPSRYYSAVWPTFLTFY